MKKVFALFLVAGAIAFTTVSCGGEKKQEESTQETMTPEETPVDSAAVSTDTTTVSGDTTAAQ